MATRHVVQLVDDIDGSEAVKTVSFGINDRQYELDLSAANLDRFERAISRFLSVARASDTAAHRRWASLAAELMSEPIQEAEPAPEEVPEPVFDGSVEDMRLWAQRKHMVVRPRARIPREIEHAYSAAANRVHHKEPTSTLLSSS